MHIPSLTVVALTLAYPIATAALTLRSEPGDNDAVLIDFDMLAKMPVAPADIDASQDYAINTRSFIGNESWAVTMRETGMMWVHQSRWHTLNSAAMDRRESVVAERSRASSWSFGLSTTKSCPTPIRTLGANSCTLLSSGRVIQSIKITTGGLVSDNSFTPKVNFYSGNGCGTYVFSYVGENGCVTGSLFDFSVIAFNQAQ